MAIERKELFSRSDLGAPNSRQRPFAFRHDRIGVHSAAHGLRWASSPPIPAEKYGETAPDKLAGRSNDTLKASRRSGMSTPLKRINARVLLAIALTITASCVSPSRTMTDYRRKAANSAESMISVAESSLLTADLASSRKAPAPFVSLRLSESEEDAEWIVTSFSAVQPPSNEADELRDEVLDTLDDVATITTQARIQAYRGEFDELPVTVAPLEELVNDLEAFKRLGET